MAVTVNNPIVSENALCATLYILDSNVLATFGICSNSYVTWLSLVDCAPQQASLVYSM